MTLGNFSAHTRSATHLRTSVRNYDVGDYTSDSCGSDAWSASDHGDSSEKVRGGRGVDGGFGEKITAPDEIPLLKDQGVRVIEKLMPIMTVPLHALRPTSKAG